MFIPSSAIAIAGVLWSTTRPSAQCRSAGAKQAIAIAESLLAILMQP